MPRPCEDVHPIPVPNTCAICWLALYNSQYATLYGMSSFVSTSIRPPKPGISSAPIRQAQSREDGARKICIHLDAQAYPVIKYPEQKMIPCNQKLRKCELYETDCTLDPRPNILLNCKNCKEFVPRK
jgi:hypothetical protein